MDEMRKLVGAAIGRLRVDEGIDPYAAVADLFVGADAHIRPRQWQRRRCIEPYQQCITFSRREEEAVAACAFAGKSSKNPQFSKDFC